MDINELTQFDIAFGHNISEGGCNEYDSENPDLISFFNYKAVIEKVTE